MLENPKVLQIDEKLTAIVHLTVARTKISEVAAPAMAEIAS